MNIGKVFAILGSLFLSYEEDQAILEAGGTATTPVETVGSVGGKPLYAWANLSTTNPNSPTPPPSPPPPVA